MGGGGFLSFVVSAIFLIGIVACGAMLSSVKPDESYLHYRAMQVQDSAIKRTFYDSVSSASSIAYDAAIASRSDSREAVREAAFLQARFVEYGLNDKGFPVAFWCGEVSERERQDASSRMALEKRAIVPDGAVSLNGCFTSFDADTERRKLHFFDMGFSLYAPSLGIGLSSILPSSYEVDF